MISNFLILLGSVGITIILTRSSLFERPREFVDSKSSLLGELVSCPMCLGMWIGFLTSLFVINNTIIFSIYYGGVTSLLGYFFESIISMFNSVSYYVDLKYEDGDS